MRIGNLEIDRPIVLAPMEDVTDMPFRQICRKRGADIVYTEFTSSEALIRDVPSALGKIRISAEERPVAIQIFGGVESSMEGAARVAESFAPDLIDINCGCWVKKVAMRAQGAGLLRDLSLFERVVRATINATSLPVTVKTRLGWDDRNINILDVARMVEDAGAKALTVHCRTRTQGYKGEADWKWLQRIKKVIGIPLIGNGDIGSPQDVARMFETGCDGVMIGRAAIGNPWIFEESKHFLRTGRMLPGPEVHERVRQCIDHLRMAVAYRGEREGVVTFRKYYSGYFYGIPFVSKLRAELMQLKTSYEVIAVLERFAQQNRPAVMV